MLKKISCFSMSTTLLLFLMWAQYAKAATGGHNYESLYVPLVFISFLFLAAVSYCAYRVYRKFSDIS